MNNDLKEFADILFAPRERDEYKRRIDKAIEYLTDEDYWISQTRANYILLAILKGSDKDEKD